MERLLFQSLFSFFTRDSLWLLMDTNPERVCWIGTVASVQPTGIVCCCLACEKCLGLIALFAVIFFAFRNEIGGHKRL